MKVGDKVWDDLECRITTIKKLWDHKEWHGPGFAVEMPDGSLEGRHGWELTEIKEEATMNIVDSLKAYYEITKRSEYRIIDALSVDALEEIVSCIPKLLAVVEAANKLVDGGSILGGCDYHALKTTLEEIKK